MGNRALVAFTSQGRSPAFAIYLHWNGGPESVYAFLDYCKAVGVREDDSYQAARFCQVVGNYLGGTLSLGIVSVDLRAADPDCAGCDNGIYVVRGWKVEKRWRGDRGRWLTEEEISDEYARAYAHAYHKAGSDKNIVAAIARANDAAFRPATEAAP